MLEIGTENLQGKKIKILHRGSLNNVSDTSEEGSVGNMFLKCAKQGFKLCIESEKFGARDLKFEIGINQIIL